MKRSLLLATLLLALVACAKKAPAPAPEESAGAMGEGGQPAASAPAREGEAPSSPAEQRVASTCPDNKTISSGDTTSPGGVVYLAYQAALKADTPEAFEEFFALFGNAVNRDHVKRHLWPRVREFAPKYTAAADNPTYVLCRTVATGSSDRVKVFVKSNDPRKSDPPIVLANENGTWRIDVMTP